MLGGKSAVAVLFSDKQCEPDINDSDRCDFRCWRAGDSSSFHGYITIRIGIIVYVWVMRMLGCTGLSLWTNLLEDYDFIEVGHVFLHPR